MAAAVDKELTGNKRICLYNTECMFCNTCVVMNMGIVMTQREKLVEVICQHTKEQEIIPIKLRIQDEDKACQDYMIKSSVCLEKTIGYYTGIKRWKFECLIEVFGKMKTILLYYDNKDHIWSM